MSFEKKDLQHLAHLIDDLAEKRKAEAMASAMADMSLTRENASDQNTQHTPDIVTMGSIEHVGGEDDLDRHVSHSKGIPMKKTVGFAPSQGTDNGKGDNAGQTEEKPIVLRKEDIPKQFRPQLQGWSDGTLDAASPASTPGSSPSASSAHITKLALSESIILTPSKEHPVIKPGKPSGAKANKSHHPPPHDYKPKPKLTKAERRAIQEQQRAEKAARKANTGASMDKQTPQKRSKPQNTPELASAHEQGHHQGTINPATPSRSMGGGASGTGVATTGSSARFDLSKTRSKAKKQGLVVRTPTQKLVPLFSHLPQYEHENSFTLNIKDKASIHPSIIQLGLQFAEMRIVGSNARCLAMLRAFQQVIRDYRTPPNTILSRHLETYLRPQIGCLVQFRQISTTMGNAIRELKSEIANIPPDQDLDESKENLCEWINDYIRERIQYADRLIIEHGLGKIVDGDVILIFARSSVVLNLLVTAHRQGIAFKVIVVDARPLFEGTKTLKALTKAGVPCQYMTLNAIGYAMKEVSKIFIGAHSIFSNGTVMSRVGTSVVAMMGHQYRIPVIVCCETYKFDAKVQLDSFVANEIGNPDDLIDLRNDAAPILSDWRDMSTLKILNLMYDVVPAEYIDMVITEIGMIPCTSVPVVLREHRKSVLSS